MTAMVQVTLVLPVLVTLLYRMTMSCVMTCIAQMTVGSIACLGGEAGVMPFWTGVEECAGYAGEVALLQTGSDEPIDNIDCASRPDGHGGPCDEDSLPWTGSDDSVPGVTPCWTGLEECDISGDDDYCPGLGPMNQFPV